MNTEENRTWTEAWAAMEGLAVSANISWFEVGRTKINQVRLLENMALEAFVNEYKGSDVETIRKCLITLQKEGFLY